MYLARSMLSHTLLLCSMCNQHVPIPTSTYVCQRNGGCCTRTNLPLTLAYARTIHKFQGQSAGPVDEGKIPNIYSCIICDPDKSEAEGRGALGMLYTAVSRATTLGDDDGLESAIYFTGDDFNEKRIRNLGKRKNALDDFQNVTRRKIWVQHLTNNTSDGNITKKQLKRALDWANTAIIDYDRLHSRVKLYIQSKIQKRYHVVEGQQSALNQSNKRQKVQ